MKTPKRIYVSLGGDTDDVITARKAKKCARWKRKNKIKQLKRTIARLEKEKVSAYHKGHKDGYDLAFARLEKEKVSAYHKGHKDGYDLAFARSWF